MFVCVFFTRTRQLYSSYTRVRPPACLAGAFFSLYFIQETIAQTYSKWCISGGPHRWALPPHLYRVGLYFPPAMIYKALLQLITGTEDIFFCNFLVTSSFWSLNVYADNAWWRVPNEKKKGLRKLYHLCPVHPNPNRHLSSLQSSFGFTQHRIQKPNRTEIVRSQGWKLSKSHRISLLGYGVQVSLLCRWNRGGI